MTRWLRSIDRSKDNALYYTIPVIGAFFRWRLRAAAALLGGDRPRRLLDVGYGSGLLLQEVRGRAGGLYGVDRHGYHGGARAWAGARGIDFRATRGDVMALPFGSEVFEAVCCMSLLEHVSDVGCAVAELWRVLKPGGVLIAGFPPKSRLTSACFKLIGFDHARFHPNSERTILAAIESCFTVDSIVSWPRHASLYMLARCVKRSGHAGGNDVTRSDPQLRRRNGRRLDDGIAE